MLENERICKIVTIADLDKLPVRVCLSTMIAHLEGLMAEIIEKQYPDENDWLSLLSDGARDEVNTVYNRKKDQDFDASMVDCTTIIYKFTILCKTRSFLEYLDISKNEYERIYKPINRLRNRYFHNLPSLTNDKSTFFL